MLLNTIKNIDFFFILSPFLFVIRLYQWKKDFSPFPIERQHFIITWKAAGKNLTQNTIESQKIIIPTASNMSPIPATKILLAPPYTGNRVKAAIVVAIPPMVSPPPIAKMAIKHEKIY